MHLAYLDFEITSMVILGAILIIDVWLGYKRPHIPSVRESSLWIFFYAALALIFAYILGTTVATLKSTEFIAGWLTEYSLSLDNLFVFVIIMAKFKVPKKLQQEVLMVGILMSLVLRGLFILVGAALIENFSWIFYLFGAFLLYTAFHQAFRSESDDQESESRLISFLRKRIHFTDEFDGIRLHTKVDGRRALTPVVVVFVAIALTDVMFAFDSIPAIFGITTDAFIVFCANVFALMGLRQLYFLLGSLIDRLEYLKYGISVILGFIGFKLVSHAMHVNELPFINGGHGIEWAPEISVETSLAVIVGSIAVSALASIIKSKRNKK